jgi:predicted deacylase
MNSIESYLKAFFLCGILLTVMFTGCIEEGQKPDEQDELLTPEIELDQSSVLPNWEDGEYHDYYGTMELLNGFNEKYPNLVNVYTIGKSVIGKDIWCIKITNEINNKEKFSCLIDGCIHGEEWEASEACLYLADYLLINFDSNSTVTGILNTTEIHIVPLVNPDGRQNNEHGNDNSVDLNRNFDIYFGRLRGHSLRLGKLFGKIKIPIIKIPFVDPGFGWFRNCGRYSFSEPEAQALRDLMKSLNYHDFSFYVNCHTATHEIVAPWDTFKPPFPMEKDHEQVLKYVGEWIEENTEYDYSMNSALKIGGETMDWVYKEFQIPSFTFEMLSMEYDAFYGENKHDHLVHWMKTTLPFFLYLLVNIENLHDWEIPGIQPLLPEGVPPAPIR